MATIPRPSTRYQPPDWFTNAYAISSNAQRQREASTQVRQETRSLRMSMDLKTQWDQHWNTTRLGDRIDAIKDVKDVLKIAKDKVDEELSLLQASKDALEAQIVNLRIPVDSVVECLILRDRRRGIDLVEDAAKLELEKEKVLTQRLISKLRQKITETFSQMNLLTESRNQLLIDLEHKNEAMSIDIDQYNLLPDWPGVSLKPNCTRIPRGTVTMQQWKDFSEYNWRRANSEVAAGQRLRQSIFNTLRDSERDIEAQAQATERALRRRKHETERALDELEWQKKQTEDEIAEMENDLQRLEEAIENTTPAAKLAQTRLERRTYRPGMELCRDTAQYGLTEEVRQIEVTKEVLLEKQRQCRHSLNALQQQLNRINDDIEIKKNSLQLERRCLELRHQRMDRAQLQMDIDPSSTAPTATESATTVTAPPTSLPSNLASNLLS